MAESTAWLQLFPINPLVSVNRVKENLQRMLNVESILGLEAATCCPDCGPRLAWVEGLFLSAKGILTRPVSSGCTPLKWLKFGHFFNHVNEQSSCWGHLLDWSMLEENSAKNQWVLKFPVCSKATERGSLHGILWSIDLESMRRNGATSLCDILSVVVEIPRYAEV